MGERGRKDIYVIFVKIFTAESVIREKKSKGNNVKF